jgi:hypothetical protein
MIVLLDTSESLLKCSEELGCPVEQLITPLTRFNRQDSTACFAIDNGAFSRFSPEAFLSLLAKHDHERNLCRFVSVPDVVGSARRTSESFTHWQHKLTGWNIALVAQDGQEDLEISWRVISAIFIGGTTVWKMSKSAADIIRCAKNIGKWVHAGRVNTPGRFEYFEELGADSIDGTGLSRYSWMRERIYRNIAEPKLFEKIK